MTDHTASSDYTGSLLMESAERAFAEFCTKERVNAAEAGTWPAPLWDALEELGFTRAALPEALEGADLPLAQVLPLVRIAGRHAAPLPLGETIIAGWLLAGAGLAVPTGPLAFAPAEQRRALALTQDGAAWRLDGCLRNIPWGSQVKRIAWVADTPWGFKVVSIDPGLATLTASTNLAGEPRCRLDFSRAPVAAADVGEAVAGVDPERAYLLGALIRGQQMAGALVAARDLAVRYAGERIAFGKPLNRLPAVQQNLAILAGQTAAANVAADMALEALAKADADLPAAIGLAKTRIGEAVEIAARLAHQVHGAIGFTYEHTLHHATRRLWAWRDEFGNEAYWAQQVGQRIVEGGADHLWTFITKAAQL